MSETPRRVLLRFNPRFLQVKEGEDLRNGLSAIAVAGETLWAVSDESVRLEQLQRLPDGSYGEHQAVSLAKLPGLPVPPANDADGEEIDVEGLHFEGDFLWLVGSHGLKRKKPEAGKSAKRNIERLAKVTADGNRCLLARIPVGPGGDLDVKSGRLLDCSTVSSELTEALLNDFEKDDENPLRRFFKIPGKDNGFDIEGLTLAGDRIFIGLRGPVLRGWAIILEVRVEEAGAKGLQLKPFDGGRRVRRHFLDLRGLGVRELVVAGDSLLILTGPTADLDGPVCVYRWAIPDRDGGDTLTWEADLPEVFPIPFGIGVDHAEGMARLEIDGAAGLLITYDTPAADRKGTNPGAGEYFADFFRL